MIPSMLTDFLVSPLLTDQFWNTLIHRLQLPQVRRSEGKAELMWRRMQWSKWVMAGTLSRCGSRRSMMFRGFWFDCFVSKVVLRIFWPEFAMQVLGVGRVWEFLIKHVLFKIFFAINIGWYKSDPGTLDDPRKLKKCETAWNCPQHVSFQHDSLCFFNSMTGETECIPFSGNSVGLWLGKLLQEMLYVGYSPAQIGATIRGPYRSPPIFGTSRFEFTSTGASMVLYLRVQVLFLREISWCCGSGVLFVQPKNI